MNARVALDVAVAFFISLIGTLLLLFAQPGLKSFSDITQLQYAIAFLSAAAVGLKALQSRLADSPANIKQANEIVSAAANLDISQKGFSRIGCLWLALGLCAALVAACNVNPPQTTRQTLLAAYASAQTAAQAIQSAKAGGQIDAAKRDELITQVEHARDLLNATRTALINDPAPGSTNDTQALTSLRAAQNILLAIQAALPKETAP